MRQVLREREFRLLWLGHSASTIGDRLVFEDMAYYSMVKTTTFNGVRLPSIAIWNSRSGSIRVVRDFGYEDFKGRLS